MDFSWEQIGELIVAIFETRIAKVIIGGLIILFIMLFLQRVVRSIFRKGRLLDANESNTMISLINSIIKYVALIGFLFYFLTVFGIRIGSMLAGAGVLGIVIGFGAQSLIQDLLGGLFIVYEKQLKTGDYVIINDLHAGTVEAIGFRILKVRKWSGALLSINNGEVQTIENFNEGRMRVIEKITTSFQQDPQQTELVLEQICSALNRELGNQLIKDITGEPVEPFKYIGMASTNEDFRGFSYYIVGLCDDATYWQTARDTRGIIAKYLYNHNIKMPEQHVLTRNFEEK
ncbi:mechanosensitive ion channel family protein [Amphibacillus indicireducens]|uniref:Mechanosensitive ion channel protein MscC n=1 Tax=Amphibacillus indicireducens TaxID=1076330 RepID=A0ABP7VM47_9BACI